MNAEVTLLANLAMEGVGEGKVGWITVFCRSDQAQVQPSVTLSTLVQWDTPRPGVVVVKVLLTCPLFHRLPIDPLTWM